MCIVAIDLMICDVVAMGLMTAGVTVILLLKLLTNDWLMNAIELSKDYSSHGTLLKVISHAFLIQYTCTSKGQIKSR
jgi:hypothetical protein